MNGNRMQYYEECATLAAKILDCDRERFLEGLREWGVEKYGVHPEAYGLSVEQGKALQAFLDLGRENGYVR